jgi:hypothetical protein
MDTVTYPDEMVVTFVQENFIPLQVAHDAKPLSGDFNIKWTPALITLGIDGREHHRTVGFLNPRDFIASGLLGLSKFHFDNAEAIFLSGVARYKHSGERQFLKDAYETLSSQYPDNEWTKRAYPYKLL